MIVMYGKGKVGESVVALCKHIDLDIVLMDDNDVDQSALLEASHIVVTPGIKPTHFVYEKFPNKILTELDFLYLQKDFFPFYDTSLFVGITGTNGKSTTSWVLHKIFDIFFSKYQPGYKCRLTGNFSRPLSSVFLELLKDNDNIDKYRHVFVVESSSFMLAYMHLFTYNYGVLLNISRDHLDRHITMNDYILAKENIVDRSRLAFVSTDGFNVLLKSHTNLTVFDNYSDLTHTHFFGDHNKQNLGAVFAIYRAICVDMGWNMVDMDFLLRDVYPLDHRLKPIKTIGTVTIIDDGICTSAAACKAALEAIPNKCVLIAGGYDKGDDYSILENLIAHKVSHLVVLGDIAERLSLIATAVGVSCTQVISLSEAVQSALTYAQKNDISYILFSPAAASFDMFKNVYDRIEQFERIVDKL